MSESELQRYADALRSELAAVTEEMQRAEALAGAAREEAAMRLSIRKRALEQRYRQTLEDVEQRRLDALRNRVRADG